MKRVEDKELRKNNKTKTFLGIVIILFLLIINAFLVWTNMEAKKEKEAIIENIEYANSVKSELKNELDETLVELVQYQGRSDELDSLLNIAKNSLIEKREYIQQLLGQKISDRNLIRTLLDEIRLTKKVYLAQIDTLFKENEHLKTENYFLRETGQRLKQRNKYLEEKYTIGSILRTANITVKTYREKSKGNYRESNNAKKVMRMEVCFDIEENKVTDNKKIEITLRIVNPAGTTLTNKNAGSGTFTIAETDKILSYTKKKTVDYDKTPKRICMRWDRSQGFPYSKGVYTVELFNNGYFIGSAEYELKKGLF